MFCTVALTCRTTVIIKNTTRLRQGIEEKKWKHDTGQNMTYVNKNTEISPFFKCLILKKKHVVKVQQNNYNIVTNNNLNKFNRLDIKQVTMVYRIKGCRQI